MSQINSKGIEHIFLTRYRRLPPEIGNLTELIYVAFGAEKIFSDLAGELPASIVKLKNITHFSLRDTKVNGTLPADLGNMSSLRLFRIYNSFVKGEIPDSVCLLVALHTLILGKNSLTGAPTCIGDLDKLRVLTLSDNSLTG